MAGVAYATASSASAEGTAATAPIGLVANTGFAPILGAVGIFIPLLFPDGRVASARWRGVAWLGVVAIVMFTGGPGLQPRTDLGSITVENPIGIQGFGGLARPGGTTPP